MKRIIGVIIGIAFLALLSSGILADIGTFLEWYFKLKYTQPDTSIAGSIVVRILTMAVSYCLVGLAFEAIGLFNSKVMAAVYTFVSTVIGFVFAYIVWQIEEHLTLIIIIVSLTIALIIALWIVFSIWNKKKQKSENDEEAKPE